MIATHIRSFVITGLAILGVTAIAAAQVHDKPLTTIEVQRLVASEQPEDQALLRDHFAELALQYDHEGVRHSAMAQGFAGNPNRQTATDSRAHCERLAKLAKDSAATLRELATYHDRLAAGVPSTLPKNSARFEAGEGSPEPTDRQLRELAAAARTPADHRGLEEYFVTAAARYTKRADEHAAMAAAYRGNVNRRGGDPAAHCDRLVKLSRDAAHAARAAATEHGHLAQVG